ncbi:MAG: sigma-70 family RNA polymerase sigma factor [Phycisphaerales bacterium]|nr:sigma-70 family RNA polymerase sigma factor [Phycisphaerales bacterium]
MTNRAESITLMLNAAAAGDSNAAAAILPMIYEELRSIARDRLRGEQVGSTLQPTALVNEAYLRLFAGQSLNWNSRGHFFSSAALAMRNILVDNARRKAALKRGGGQMRVSDEDWDAMIEPPAEDVLALDEALSELEHSDPRKAQIVLLHCFCGLSLEETANIMQVSLSTIEREWRFTRALLRTRLDDRA